MPSTRNVRTLVIQLVELDEDDDTRKQLRASTDGREITTVVRSPNLEEMAHQLLGEWLAEQTPEIWGS